MILVRRGGVKTGVLCVDEDEDKIELSPGGRPEVKGTKGHESEIYDDGSVHLYDAAR